MGKFAEYVENALGVELPEDYVGFMEKYGKKLSADPISQNSYIPGLGDADFVVGTTLAFRSRLPNFSIENVVIGYLGVKTIVVNRAYEEIDNYMILSTQDRQILAVDSRGVAEMIAGGFEEWVGPELLRAKLKEQYQSTLTVVLFEDEKKAAGAREKLLNLQRQGHIDLEDVVVVVKEPDGTTRYYQPRKGSKKGAAVGSITGFIVGSIFFTPLVGAAIGAAAAAISTSLGGVDMGIDDQFLKDLAQKFNPGCSALFTLVRRANPEKVGEAFFGFGGKVLVNSMSKQREATIQEFLDAAREKTE